MERKSSTSDAESSAVSSPDLVARYAGRQSAEVIVDDPKNAPTAVKKAAAGTIIIVPGRKSPLQGVAWQKIEPDGLIARK
jgi:hypothetical protein